MLHGTKIESGEVRGTVSVDFSRTGRYRVVVFIADAQFVIYDHNSKPGSNTFHWRISAPNLTASNRCAVIVFFKDEIAASQTFTLEE